MQKNGGFNEGDKLGRYVITSKVMTAKDVWLYDATDSTSVSGGTKVLIREAISDKMLAAYKALSDCPSFLIRETFSVDGKNYAVFSKPDAKPYSASIGKLSTEELKSQLLLLLPDLEKMHAQGLVHGRLSTNTIYQMSNGYPGIFGMGEAHFNKSQTIDVRMLRTYCQQLLSKDAKQKAPHIATILEEKIGANKESGITTIASFRKEILKDKPPMALPSIRFAKSSVRQIGLIAGCIIAVSLAVLSLQILVRNSAPSASLQEPLIATSEPAAPHQTTDTTQTTDLVQHDTVPAPADPQEQKPSAAPPVIFADETAEEPEIDFGALSDITQAVKVHVGAADDADAVFTLQVMRFDIFFHTSDRQSTGWLNDTTVFFKDIFDRCADFIVSTSHHFWLDDRPRAIAFLRAYHLKRQLTDLRYRYAIDKQTDLLKLNALIGF